MTGWMMLRNGHMEKPMVEKDEAAGTHRSLNPASWNAVLFSFTSSSSSVPNTWFVQRVSSCEQMVIEAISRWCKVIRQIR